MHWHWAGLGSVGLTLALACGSILAGPVPAGWACACWLGLCLLAGTPGSLQHEGMRLRATAMSTAASQQP